MERERGHDCEPLASLHLETMLRIDHSRRWLSKPSSVVSTDGLCLPGWISFISEAELVFSSFQPLNHRKGDLRDFVCRFSDTGSSSTCQRMLVGTEKGVINFSEYIRRPGKHIGMILLSYLPCGSTCRSFKMLVLLWMRYFIALQILSELIIVDDRWTHSQQGELREG